MDTRPSLKLLFLILLVIWLATTILIIPGLMR